MVILHILDVCKPMSKPELVEATEWDCERVERTLQAMSHRGLVVKRFAMFLITGKGREKVI